ncbi:TrbC/VirB2 family protein [Cupriavidus necator]
MRNSIHDNKSDSAVSIEALLWVAAILGGLSPTLALGQEFTHLNTTLKNIADLLRDAGVAVVTIAIIWAGYKMIFQHSRWSDVSTVVLGAIFIGAAGAVANWLVNTK